MLFPTSVANSLIAVGTDGIHERDRMVRAAIAIVCELGEWRPRANLIAWYKNEPVLILLRLKVVYN